MATKSAVSPAERVVISDALDMLIKSLERSERAAKDAFIAAAYKKTAGDVRALKARIESGELEI